MAAENFSLGMMVLWESSLGRKVILLKEFWEIWDIQALLGTFFSDVKEIVKSLLMCK